jgi:hypothetical protein
MLHVVTFRWGSKYAGHYVERLKAGIARNLKQEYIFGVFAPMAEDEYLTKIPGCFCRLRAFDPEWQARHNIIPGDRIVSIDLDTVITGPLDPLFDIGDEFAILLNANMSNPLRYNGSVFSFMAGYRPDVWSDFSLKSASQIRYSEFPDDQAWLEHECPDAKNWEVGPDSGIYAFAKKKWPAGEALPKDARIVAFPGWRDPSKFSHLDWIKNNWK